MPPPQQYAQPQQQYVPQERYIQPAPAPQRRTVWLDPPANSIVKIIPGLPDPESVKSFTLQVGSYRDIHNASAASQKVSRAGFEAVQEICRNEQYGELHRVCVKGVPAANVYNISQRLGEAGFNVVWVRE
jgi:cell division septation protein DedD